MPATARELLIEKIDRLPPARVAEVEDFVDFLTSRDTDRELAQAVTAAAAPSFAKIWDNPDDDVYNDI
ncbi:MAG: toxin-antitoxin system, antitoxin component, Xre family protein [Polyangia bacterium]|jgi:ABC-type glycerol-3-phosphate transport system substrate-binding protein